MFNNYIKKTNLFAVFWGGREGYHTLLNTDVRRELDHMGSFFQMVVGVYKSNSGSSDSLVNFSVRLVDFITTVFDFRVGRGK